MFHSISMKRFISGIGAVPRPGEVMPPAYKSGVGLGEGRFFPNYAIFRALQNTYQNYLKGTYHNLS